MKFKRFLTLLVLVVMGLTLSISVASAAGEETWSSNQGPTEYMRITNYNITPVKTIGKAGYLSIYYNMGACKEGYCNCSDREPSSYPPAKVTVQIRSYPSGEVLAEEWFMESVFFYPVTTSRPLAVGEKVQIYFDISTYGNSTPPGPYRKAHVKYYYEID